MSNKKKAERRVSAVLIGDVPFHTYHRLIVLFDGQRRNIAKKVLT